MIIGHHKQWAFLKKNFELNRLSHAYLFTGLESLGRMTFALEFVKLINCQNEDFNKKPCQKCDYCRMIEKRKYPDLFIVSPSSFSKNSETGLEKEKKSIQISQIRGIQDFLSRKSYYGSFKSVIIDRAEIMTQEAQSCLLKTLEETKGQTILILVSSNSDILLPTICSRCQIIKFFPVERTEIEKHLLEQGIAVKNAEMLADICEGRPGRAINFLLNSEKLEKEKEVLNEILEICQSGLVSRFQYIKNINLNNGALIDVLEILKRYFRYLLFLKIGITKFSDFNYFPRPSERMKSYSVAKLKEIIKHIENIGFYVSLTNVNPRLALEILMLEI